MNFKRSVTTSYENSVLCQVCHFKKKRSELRLRWDGLWVCNEDWENRHPTDFYRNRNDAHVLPYVLSDDGQDPETSWSCATWGGVVVTLNDNEASNISANATPGFSFVDELQGKTRASSAILFSKTDNEGYTYIPARPLSTTSNDGTPTHRLALPTTATTGGSATFITSYGVVLGTRTLLAGDAFAILPQWNTTPGHVYVSLIYGT